MQKITISSIYIRIQTAIVALEALEYLVLVAWMRYKGAEMNSNVITRLIQYYLHIGLLFLQLVNTSNKLDGHQQQQWRH